MSMTVATFNAHAGTSIAGMRSDLEKIIGAGADVISMQEVPRSKGKQLRAWLASQGYGFTLENGVPVAYKLSKFKMVAHGSRHLSDARNVSGSGKVHRTRAVAQNATWLTLVDRQTGQKSIFSNAHFTASRMFPGRKQLWHQQLKRYAQLQRDLRKKYGRDADIFAFGDLNTSKPGSLAEMRRNTGMKTYRAPRKTHSVGYIDWIMSNQARGNSRVIGGLRSDHNAYLMTFGGGSPGGGGGNGDHTGNFPTPGPSRGHPHGNGGNGGDNGDDGDVPTSAFELFSDLLESWGVPVGSDIERIIRQAIRDGITPDRIGLLIPEIQKTHSWKTRFPGWEQRVKNGYNQISVDEYLQLENQYHRIMQEAGLPAGFYDDPSDFGNWIANDVSPDEIGNRVGLATNAAKQIDPTMRNLMAKFYGLTPGDVASYFLDSKRALPVIERQYNAAGVASWAKRNGLAVNEMGRFESLVDAGVTIDQAAAGYGTVAALSDTVGRAAGVYGTSYNQGDAESDVFFNQSEKRQKIMSNEAATFGGSSSGSTGSAKRQSY